MHEMRLLNPPYLALLAAALWAMLWSLRARQLAPRWRRRGATLLRALLLVALTLALAGLALPIPTVRHTLFILLDWSDSMGVRGRNNALRTARALTAATSSSTSTGVLLFGAESSLELDPEPRTSLPLPASHLDTRGTNLEQALQRATASFTRGGGRHLILVSDGNENLGQARTMIPVLKSLGIKLWSVPMTPEASDNDVYVSRIIVPESVREEEAFPLKVIVESHQETVGELVVLRDDLLVAQEQVRLHAGQNAFTYRVKETSKGLHRYEASINAPDDPLVENNRLRRFVETLGEPLILYVQEAGVASAPLQSLLTAQGFDVVRRPVADLPDTLSGYLAYDAIIFDNVSGFQVSMAKMDLIERYVRDTGGGFMMVGGDRSFSAGGYYRTPIEKVLPVSMDVKSEMTMPSIAMLLVIDKSGSMTGTIFNETKLDIAKVASFAAAELLNPADRVGLLAFDAQAQWVAPLMPARNRGRIAEGLGRLESGGGTDLYLAVKLAFQTIKDENAVIKHILVLSDGLTEKRDFESLAAAAKAAKVTISTVAMGDDANLQLMHNLAEWTGGRSYFTNDPLTIPRIFTNETLLAARNLIIEGRAAVRADALHEVFHDLPAETVPDVDGYVLTFPKTTADVVLRVGEKDPLLATWRYGLGRAAAFTSDLQGRWSADFLNWQSLPQLTGQLLRWLQRPSSAQRLHASIHAEGERATLEVSVYDASDHFLNDAALTAVRTRVGGEPQELRLEQVAPGTYRASFPAPAAGEEIFTISGSGTLGAVGPLSIGYSVPYTREYLSSAANLALLRELAEGSGGGMLSSGETADRFLARIEGEGGRATDFHRLWRALSLIALGLLLLDIAVRRVSLPDSVLSAWQRRFGASAVPEASLDYDALSDMIRTGRREQRRGEPAKRRGSEEEATRYRPGFVYMAGLRDIPTERAPD